MESNNSRFGSYLDTVWDQIAAGADHVPNLLAALLLLLFGWFIARLARQAIKRFARASNSLLERTFPSGILAEARVSELAAAVLGEIIFWVVLLVTVTIAAGMAGLSTVADWLDRITTYIPQLIAGVTIVVAGFFLSIYVREQLKPRAVSGGPAQKGTLARVAQGLVISTALIVGLDQVGIAVALLVALYVVGAAALLIGLAVSFALGARTHISNLIGMRSARPHLGAGVRIRIDNIEGEILETTPSQIALTTDQGKVLVPGRFIDEQTVTIVAADVGKDAEHV